MSDETKFTKGPWEVASDWLDIWVRSATTKKPITDAQLPSDNDFDCHLIAAAPDLYESLKHAVAIIKQHVPEDALGFNSEGGGDGYNDRSWPLLDEYLHYMNAALARARGESL